ncbi:Methyltransferase domain-containing protein [Halopenitus malekzadehii]|uniref:Methyltransferase domain-containing protein n=1 Tax=Halopenitus malekzadehii TaxID=1267564 RepID=A0A1H6J8C9_9EURY|nr:class I SAM-dependent methyltransferase [Halopenitus malekzadehii]SEH55040.1 Methyltransferase domain-containing protein [Halopenitus malekzadehii]
MGDETAGGAGRGDPPALTDHDPIATYDRIATHFSKTREYAWPEVESFLADRTAVRAIDVGCGNGRHTELLADRAETALGVDASRGLLREACTRAEDRGIDASFLQGDAAALPVTTGTADLGIYVATIHHLRPRRRRIRSLNELARVLDPGGVALVSTWSAAHDRFADVDPVADADVRAVTDEEGTPIGFDTTVDWTLPGGERVPRFYHVYTPAGFRTDLAASDLSIESFEVSSGNCYVTVRLEPGSASKE